MIIEFSPESRRAFFRARAIADEAQHEEIQSEAILAALFAEKSLALANLAFGSREHVETVGRRRDVRLSDEARAIVRKFEVEDDKEPHPVSTGDLLLAFLSDVQRFVSVAAAHNLPLSRLRIG